MRKRNISIPIRVTEKELEEIDAKAQKAKKNRTEYLISSALGKEITIIDDLKELTMQLRRIGNNLNQLTKKANSHEIKVVDLEETNESLGEIYQAIFALAILRSQKRTTQKSRSSAIASLKGLWKRSSGSLIGMTSST